MKKLLSAICAITMLFSSGVMTSAEEYDSIIDDGPVIEEFSYTNSVFSGLYISNKTATCSSSVEGYYGIATKIEVTQTLQRLSGSSWTGTSYWTNTYYSWYCNFDNTKSSLFSGTYRVKTVAKVYSGSSYETITAYSYECGC